MKMCPDCFGSNIKDGICGDCGFNTAEYVWEDYQLPLFTVIGGKYIIGRAIGEGGFGITYTAYNKELNAKYAVKEYYPAEISGRGYSSPDGMTIYPFSGYDDEFAKGLERFEREAKQLAQFDGMEGIVNVKDYITENGTGYIFMEFVSGKSLETYLTEHNGRVSFLEASEILKPVISALSQLHKKGLIHRDISPDNIIISEKSGPILIDFGASRNYSDEKSMSVIVKYGYAPFEQYSRHGGQGPWTDVYAVSAVLYRMITGKKPPDSVARIQDSAELTPLSELCDDVPPACEAVIMKGLAVNKEDRLQSMDELYKVLYENGKAGSRKKPIIAAALVAAVIVAAAFSAIKLSDRDAEEAIALHTTDESVTQYTDAPQTSQRIEIVTAAPSYEPYSPTVMYGLPTYEDEAYIRGRLVIDLANTEKAAADDPSALLKVKPSVGSPIAPIEPAFLEKEDPPVSQSFGVLIIPPAINSFSEYVGEHGFDFEKDKPVYSYVMEDMDGDSENEYYICAAFALNTSETAYLIYYKENDGSIELICCGKLYAKNCESVFLRDAQIFYRSGEKYLSADISNENKQNIELCENSFTMVDKENTDGQ